jgi:spore maturation protein A
MLGKIFGIIAVLSAAFAVFTGKINAVGIAAADGAGSAVMLTLSLAGMMCLWSGIIRVLKAAGLMDLLTKIISPVLKIIFPQTYNLKKQGDKNAASALQSVSANIGANILGIGNAATPFGIDAMKKLNALNINANDMIMFVVINCASLQVIPTTLIALRSAAGSADAFDIMPAIWICSLATMTFAVTVTKILSFFFSRGKKANKGE